MAVRTVLLIDGDADSREIYGAILLHHGFRVILADGDALAIDLAGGDRPDLVILEPFSTPTGPTTVVEFLRRNPSTADLPFLLITAVPGRLETGEFKLLSTDRWLSKPCEPRRMIQVVEGMLELGPTCA